MIQRLLHTVIAVAALCQASAQTDLAPPAVPPPPSPSQPPVPPAEAVRAEIQDHTESALREASDAIRQAFDQVRSVGPEIRSQIDKVTRQFAQSSRESNPNSDPNGRGRGPGDDEAPEGWGPFTGGPRSLMPPVMVRSKNDAEDSPTLREDLAVMHRILNRALDRRSGRESHEYATRAMGIEVFTFGGSKRPQSMYLEGYGALFMLNASFPLKSAPSPKEEKVEQPEDTEWERTRRELQGREQGGNMINRVFTKLDTLDLAGGNRAVRYDAQRVEDLKKDLLEAMKNASNLRDLKADDSIAVVVTGPRAASVERAAAVRKRGDNEDDDPPREKRSKAPHGPDGGLTTMTLRVKKADAEAFGSGKLSLDDFKAKSAINVY